MSHADIVQQFNRDGAAIVRQVFTPAQVEELRRQVDHFIAHVAPTMGGTDVFYEDTPARPLKSAFRLEQRSEYFRALMWDQRMVELLNAIYPGDGLDTPIGVALFAKSARDGSVTPAHQDNGFQHWKPPLALTLTIAVDRSTPENGALTCNRGSQTLGLLPHRPSGVKGFSQCLVTPIDPARYPPMQFCMEPGDISIHHIDVVHYSGANVSPHPRRQIGISYRSLRALRDEASFARYKAALDSLMSKATS